MTSDCGEEVWREKDGRVWRIGRGVKVAWIRENTGVSRTITSAIPPRFAAYATLEQPGTGDHDGQSWLEDRARHDAAVLALLAEQTVAQPWWLG
jgi:hypothetical protein